MRKKELVLLWRLMMSLLSPTAAQAATSQPDSLANDLALMPDTITVTYDNYTVGSDSIGETG